MVTAIKRTYKRPTVGEVFDSVLEARELATNTKIKDIARERPLVTITRDMAEMLGYFRDTPGISATKAFAPLIEKALKAKYGLIECPFETDDFAGVRLAPGMRIDLKKSVFTTLMNLKEALGYSTDQSLYNAALYTGCLSMFPSFEEYDDVVIAVPSSRFKEGVNFYNYYENRKFKSVDLRVFNKENATVIEDADDLSHQVKLRCLDENIILPKYYLYHVED